MAETAGAITLFTAANLGAPVSTTHTIAGSISWRWRNKTIKCSTLGHYHQPDLGMDTYNSCKRFACRRIILVLPPFFCLVLFILQAY